MSFEIFLLSSTVGCMHQIKVPPKKEESMVSIWNHGQHPARRSNSPRLDDQHISMNGNRWWVVWIHLILEKSWFWSDPFPPKTQGWFTPSAGQMAWHAHRKIWRIALHVSSGMGMSWVLTMGYGRYGMGCLKREPFHNSRLKMTEVEVSSYPLVM